jgi:hypothetical protein
MKEFWEKANSASPKPDAEKQEPNAEISDKDAGSEGMGALYKASILRKSQSEQGFQKPSRTAQEHLTNSNDEFVRCISDTLTRIPHEEETAHAPLRGASPQTVQSVSENEEDSPTANDCTALALVEAVPSQPAPLLAENQDWGVEPRDCHEGACSAAPVAGNKFFSTLAIANQIQGQVEQGYSASFSGENQVSGGEVKAVHEGTCSAVSVPNSEKWSHEAIVARSNMRPERMQKLKVAANPGFEFLQECWNDDPALQIVIKKLVAKFPQWGIACEVTVEVQPGRSLSTLDRLK